MSDMSLWKKKELAEFKRKFRSELPPYYNFEEVRQAHQTIEATVLEHWEILHPVIQDFITSWFHQWSARKKEVEGLVTEKQQKSSMLDRFKKSTVNKIELLNSHGPHGIESHQTQPFLPFLQLHQSNPQFAGFLRLLILLKFF